MCCPNILSSIFFDTDLPTRLDQTHNPNSPASGLLQRPPLNPLAHPTSTAERYWRANLRLVAALLAVWFTVSFGFGILLAERLNTIVVFGFKLGFWWAQQGSIFVFVILIFVYAALMKRIDRQFGVDDEDTPS